MPCNRNLTANSSFALGCRHYSRGCRLRASCCNELFWVTFPAKAPFGRQGAAHVLYGRRQPRAPRRPGPARLRPRADPLLQHGVRSVPARRRPLVDAAEAPCGARAPCAASDAPARCGAGDVGGMQMQVQMGPEAGWSNPNSPPRPGGRSISMPLSHSNAGPDDFANVPAFTPL